MGFGDLLKVRSSGRFRYCCSTPLLEVRVKSRARNLWIGSCVEHRRGSDEESVVRRGGL